MSQSFCYSTVSFHIAILRCSLFQSIQSKFNVVLVEWSICLASQFVYVLFWWLTSPHSSHVVQSIYLTTKYSPNQIASNEINRVIITGGHRRNRRYAGRHENGCHLHVQKGPRDRFGQPLSRTARLFHIELWKYHMALRAVFILRHP